MMTLLVLAGFTTATLLSQLLLGGRKVQERAGWVAVVQGAIAAVVLALGSRWLAVSPFEPAVFWLGAALSWFVVRSHLESSILLAMLVDVSAGCGKREELLQRHAGEGFARRVEGLRRAGLIDQQGQDPAVTGRGRVVLALFALPGGATDT
jgi:hypothetical protein